MKKVLITGASGFVGSNLARFMLSRGHEIHLMLREGFKAWRLNDIIEDVHVHMADIKDREAVKQEVGKIRPNWIFHLAAYGAYSTQMDAHNILLSNIIGTANLLDACLAEGFEAFINTGSSSEYGFKDHPPAETEQLDPNSYYAVSKASATLYCRYTAIGRKAPINTLRLYSVYGPYEEPARFIPTIITKGLRNTLPPLVNPETARDYVYVDDVSRAYLLAAENAHKEGGAVYNVGTGVQTTIRQVVEIARRVLNISAIPRWGTMENRIWDTRIWVADNRLIREKLGWLAGHDFESGFRKMVDWFRDNRELTDRFYR